MSIFASMKGWSGRVRTNLTSLDAQPLSKASLVIILFLDIFIITSIFDGLARHTKQLSAPEEYIPYPCIEIVLNRDWNPTSRVQNLSDVVLWYHTSYYYPSGTVKLVRHPVCTPYHDVVEQIKTDRELAKVFDDRARFKRESQELQRQINDLKGSYDTSLLETIAKQQEGQPNVDRIKADYQAKTNALNDLQGRIAAAEQTIEADEKVRRLWAMIGSLTPADRERLRSDLRNLNFWYPVKRLGMQMLFLLPLFIVFYLWNHASIKHERGIQVLVSSHLLVVSFIPIFFKLIEAIYDIIPKKFLKEFLEWLESLKLVALWNYIIIALAVAAALFLIYIFQRKLFSQARLMQRRIAKGQCQRCGKRLPPGVQACPFCGFVQFKVCDACGRPTLVQAKHCTSCGKGQ